MKKKGGATSKSELNSYFKEKFNKLVERANKSLDNNEIKEAISTYTNLRSEFVELDAEEQETLRESLISLYNKINQHKLGVVESYPVSVDGASVKVEIKKDLLGYSYHLTHPEISSEHEELISSIRNELIAMTHLSIEELTDYESFSETKQKFKNEAYKIIKQRLSKSPDELTDFLISKLIQDMLGLGMVEFLISDPNLEEIVIVSAKEPIRVYSKKYGWLNTNMKIDKEEDIVNYSNIIARRVEREITVLNPLLDAHLITGDRINAVLYPINTKGNTITIRKFARDPYTIVDLISNKTCNLDIASLIWLAIEYEMNILVSGGTASGKTSFLNAVLPFIPPNQRIISIEDTRELMLPEFLYWTPLVTRLPNAESKGEVSMLDLIVNSLRMRPDRIILGEMRRKEEAMVLFEAMHTGHSVYATVHADTTAETIARLINPPIEVPPNLLKAVNLNVVMFRDRRKGIRRVLQLSEFNVEEDKARPTIIYRWEHEDDKMIKHSENFKFFEDISRNTGMTEKEIESDLNEKKEILSWLGKNNLRDLTTFGKIMNLYYKNKKLLMKAIKDNDIKAVL